MGFANIYEVDSPAGGKLVPLKKFSLPRKLFQMCLASRKGTETFWCTLDDNSIREYQIINNIFTEKTTCPFILPSHHVQPLNIRYDPEIDFLFIHDWTQFEEEIYIAANRKNRWEIKQLTAFKNESIFITSFLLVGRDKLLLSHKKSGEKIMKIYQLE